MELKYNDKDNHMVFSYYVHNKTTGSLKKQHFHDSFEIYYLIKGQCDYLIEDQLYHIEAGDLVFIQRYKLHSTLYQKETINERYLFNFIETYITSRYPEEVSMLLAQLALTPVIRFKEKDKGIKARGILEDINKLIKDEDDLTNLLLEFKFKELLLLMASCQEGDRLRPRITTRAEEGILKVAKYLHNHYEEKITLESISERFFYSPHYLSRKFKSVTGFGLIDYLQAIRVREAQSLLLSSDEKVVIICEKCGFGSISQFQRVFRQQCDTTPIAFRRTYKNNKSLVV